MTKWQGLLTISVTKKLREVDHYVIEVLNGTEREMARDNFMLSVPSTKKMKE